MVETMTDDNDGRLGGLSRRKLLGGLGTIGAAGAVGGLGTSALLSDDEMVASTVTAGELDLRLDWKSYYNGKIVGQDDFGALSDNVSGSIQTEPTNTDGEVILTLGDVKPGDCGCTVLSVHINNNPAFLWMQGEAESHENGVIEAEQEAEEESETEFGIQPSDGEEGELADAIHANIFYDDSFDCQFNPVFDTEGTEVSITAEDVPSTEDGDHTTPPYTQFRTLTDTGIFNGGILLDGVRGTGILSRQLAAEGELWLSPFYQSPEDAVAEMHADNRPGTASNTLTDFNAQSVDDDTVYAGNTTNGPTADSEPGTQYIAFSWCIPKEVGNVIQGDSLEIDLTVYAQQARHNGFPTNPFDGSDPEYPVDLVPEVEADKAAGESSNYYGDPYA